jgi:hypothetical protein
MTARFRFQSRSGVNMNSFSRRQAILTGAGALTAAVGFAGPAEAATGSVYFKIVSAGFIFGVSGGNGTLRFGGAVYPFSVGGVSAGAIIGASAAELVGTAFHLHRPGDIAGVYSALGAGLAVAGGPKVARLVNANGVELHLRGKQIGLMFSLDLSGLAISMA